MSVEHPTSIAHVYAEIEGLQVASEIGLPTTRANTFALLLAKWFEYLNFWTMNSRNFRKFLELSWMIRQASYTIEKDLGEGEEL